MTRFRPTSYQGSPSSGGDWSEIAVEWFGCEYQDEVWPAWVVRLKVKGHMLNYFGAHAHLFDTVFLGVVGVSRGSSMVLAVA